MRRPGRGRRCARNLAICSNLVLLAVAADAAGAQSVDDAGSVAEPTEEEETIFLDILPVESVKDGLDWMSRVGFAPDIETLGPKSGLALSWAFHRFEPFFAKTGLSVEGSQLHTVGLAIGDADYGADLSYTFRRDAEDEFWGIGRRHGAETRTDFLRDKQEVAANVWYRLHPWLLINTGVGYENNRVDTGRDGDLPNLESVFDDQELLGMGERVELVRVSVTAALRLMRIRGFRREGVALQIGTSAFRGIARTEADFNRYFGQLRAYKPLGSRHMLALRTLVEVNRSHRGGGIPFYDLARLGGGRNGPRGFTGGRFRDRDGLSIMAEWRTEVWRNESESTRVQAVLFLDQGGVFRSLGDMGESELHTSWGVGARLMEKEKTGLATFVYAARSKEGTEFGLKTHWPF